MNIHLDGGFFVIRNLRLLLKQGAAERFFDRAVAQFHQFVSKVNAMGSGRTATPVVLESFASELIGKLAQHGMIKSYQTFQGLVGDIALLAWETFLL